MRHKWAGTLRLVATMLSPPSPLAAAAGGARTLPAPAHRAREGSGYRGRAYALRGCRASSRGAAEAQPAAASPQAPHTARRAGVTWHLPDGEPLSLLQSRSSQSSAAPLRARGASEDVGIGAGYATAPADVRIVDNEADAEAIVRLLMTEDTSGRPRYHAVDTEVRQLCCCAAASARLSHAASGG
jgi:hypothetical protein